MSARLGPSPAGTGELSHLTEAPDRLCLPVGDAGGVPHGVLLLHKAGFRSCTALWYTRTPLSRVVGLHQVAHLILTGSFRHAICEQPAKQQFQCSTLRVSGSCCQTRLAPEVVAARQAMLDRCLVSVVGGPPPLAEAPPLLAFLAPPEGSRWERGGSSGAEAALPAASGQPPQQQPRAGGPASGAASSTSSADGQNRRVA